MLKLYIYYGEVCCQTKKHYRILSTYDRKLGFCYHLSKWQWFVFCRILDTLYNQL